MPQDLNYGYIKPTPGDESATQFCDIISDDIERLADHVHDGNDSSLLPSSSINKSGMDLTAQKLSFPSVVCTNGDQIVDLLSVGATAGMYVKGTYLPLEASILSVTGTSATLSLAPTGSGTDTLELSHWKRTQTSVYEQDVILPTGFTSASSFFKFYITTVSSDYYNQEIFPSVIYSNVNQVTIKVNDNDYDMKMVIL